MGGDECGGGEAWLLGVWGGGEGAKEGPGKTKKEDIDFSGGGVNQGETPKKEKKKRGEKKGKPWLAPNSNDRSYATRGKGELP